MLVYINKAYQFLHIHHIWPFTIVNGTSDIRLFQSLGPVLGAVWCLAENFPTEDFTCSHFWAQSHM